MCSNRSDIYGVLVYLYGTANPGVNVTVVYRDEPPTEPGSYWCRVRNGMESVFYIGDEEPRIRTCMGWFSTEQIRDIGFQFGPRVPDPLTCAEIERGSDER